MTSVIQTFIKSKPFIKLVDYTTNRDKKGLDFIFSV